MKTILKKPAVKIPQLVLNRIEAGVAYLNVIDPKWFQRMEKQSKFSISNTKTCVLGTVFGDYSDALDRFSIDDSVAENMGFDDANSNRRGYANLQAGWLQKFAQLRRKAAKAKKK